jgi:hypothetical protein
LCFTGRDDVASHEIVDCRSEQRRKSCDPDDRAKTGEQESVSEDDGFTDRYLVHANSAAVPSAAGTSDLYAKADALTIIAIMAA